MALKTDCQREEATSLLCEVHTAVSFSGTHTPPSRQVKPTTHEQTARSKSPALQVELNAQGSGSHGSQPWKIYHK